MKINPSWLKIDVNIFSNKKVRRLRKMPEGDSIFTLWVWMICEGMKNVTNPGALEIAPGVPMNENDFSDSTDIKLDTVKMALSAFSELGMILPNENGVIQIKNFRNTQSLDKLERKRLLTNARVKKYREKNNELQRVTTLHVTDQSRVEESRVEESKREKKEHPKYPSFKKLFYEWLAYLEKTCRMKLGEEAKQKQLDKEWVFLDELFTRYDDYFIREVINYATKNDFWLANLHSLESFPKVAAQYMAENEREKIFNG